MNHQDCDDVFMPTQLQKEMSKKVPVAQVLGLIQRASKPDQPELSCSIDLEIVYA